MNPYSFSISRYPATFTAMLFALALLFTISKRSTYAEETGQYGSIQFSDGDKIEGAIAMTPDGSLRMHAEKKLWTFALERVREIRLSPEKEEMIQKWRFPEAGKTQKEFFGAPYPIRHLRATVLLSGNETLTGHLYTTTLYVTTSNETKKVILKAKQRGLEGQSMDSLVYPTRITFQKEPIKTKGAIHILFTNSVPVKYHSSSCKLELAALTRPALGRLTAHQSQKPNEYWLPSPLGSSLFIAVRTGQQIRVGWVSESDESLTDLVNKALADAKDFFDERELLGIFKEPTGNTVYTLLMLSRAGKTTLDAPRSQPWRLGVWRWKYDVQGNRLMLAGRGYFYRGIMASKGESLPSIVLSERLWTISQKNSPWIISKE